jgi:molecular chaperone GrpE
MTGTHARTEAEQPADGGHPPPPSGEVAGGARPAPVRATTTDIDDDRLLRALADLDNLRKRFQREVGREREAERFRVASEWLPVVDDLDRAVEHVTEEAAKAAENGDGQPGSVPEGLRVVRQHALDVLARLGYLRFGDVGDRFDPVRHEAVGAVDADAEPGTVLAVVRPGYGTAEVILRPAAVVVAKGAP